MFTCYILCTNKSDIPLVKQVDPKNPVTPAHLTAKYTKFVLYFLYGFRPLCLNLTKICFS